MINQEIVQQKKMDPHLTADSWHWKWFSGIAAVRNPIFENQMGFSKMCFLAVDAVVETSLSSSK